MHIRHTIVFRPAAVAAVAAEAVADVAQPIEAAVDEVTVAADGNFKGIFWGNVSFRRIAFLSAIKNGEISSSDSFILPHFRSFFKTCDYTVIVVLRIRKQYLAMRGECYENNGI